METVESAEKLLTLSTWNNTTCVKQHNLCLLFSVHIRKRIDLRDLSSTVNGLYLTVFKAAKSVLVFYIKLDIIYGGFIWPGGRSRSMRPQPVSTAGTCRHHGLSRSEVSKLPWSLPNRKIFLNFNVELWGSTIYSLAIKFFRLFKECGHGAVVLC